MSGHCTYNVRVERAVTMPMTRHRQPQRLQSHSFVESVTAVLCSIYHEMNGLPLYSYRCTIHQPYNQQHDSFFVFIQQQYSMPRMMQHLQRHRAASLLQQGFLVGLCLQSAVNHLSKSVASCGKSEKGTLLL